MVSKRTQDEGFSPENMNNNKTNKKQVCEDADSPQAGQLQSDCTTIEPLPRGCMLTIAVLRSRFRNADECLPWGTGDTCSKGGGGKPAEELELKVILNIPGL